MKILYTFTLMLALLVPASLFAQGSNGSLHTDMALKYLVKEPAVKSASSPIIILLHGYGSNEADLFSLAAQLPPQAIVLAAQAPISMGANSYAWYLLDRSNAGSKDVQGQEKARQLVLQFIEQAAKKYKVPASRIYLLGFSQGAIMSYNIALMNPEKVRGIAVLSGRLMEETRPNIVSADKVNKVSIFIAHGTEDAVIPIKTGRDAHTYLTGKNIKTEYHEYKMPHTISEAEMVDVRKWLEGSMKK